MKHTLLIVGEELHINEPFKRYIISSYEAHFGEATSFYLQSKSDKNLPFMIEEIIGLNDSLVIYAGDDSFATVAKILATLGDDELLLNGDLLAPSKSEVVTKNGALLKIGECEINLILARPAQKLGAILGSARKDFAYFSLFDIDSESANILLTPLAKTYEVELTSSELIPNWVLIRARAGKFGQIASFFEGVQNLFSNKMIPYKNEVEFITSVLMQKGLKITFAESCTAGLLSARFGDIAGVSEVFDGSLITYSNQLKHSWLGVGDEVLKSYGAVSEPCVQEMLKGALARSGADFALAVSGIAGPGGGTSQKPVGTVYVGAASSKGGVLVERLLLAGDREYVRTQSVTACIACLLRLAPDVFFA
ncbi:CinA family protein [Campylobacter sp. 19-13652]|uniref:CinA family protein n=1 Tax=Campylobacter sp. 19-13652 TaxID=2840180 RepID=UPI001C77E62B|nr:CinA family protein [Campylobacter sp. 19-13652]BCX79779.1 competence damage-inducible protein A [Campylobacter sp. 19-13652]